MRKTKRDYDGVTIGGYGTAGRQYCAKRKGWIKIKNLTADVKAPSRTFAVFGVSFSAGQKQMIVRFKTDFLPN
jgi:hypothetical protein